MINTKRKYKLFEDLMGIQIVLCFGTIEVCLIFTWGSNSIGPKYYYPLSNFLSVCDKSISSTAYYQLLYLS